MTLRNIGYIINLVLISGFFGGKCDIYRTDNAQIYDRRGYIMRVLSSSYYLNENGARYAQYLKEIGEIFDMFSEDGLIRIPPQTVSYIGKIVFR